MRNRIAGFIFDLDGVLVDTARFHFLAWRRLAQELGFDLTPETNERLKGVSRARSLEIILEKADRRVGTDDMGALMEKKNGWYMEYISAMKPADVLSHVRPFVRQARAGGLKTAIGSASRNAPAILERTALAPFFDAVIDGNVTSVAKPDPDVFLLAAKALQLPPQACVVFEDSASGVEAARRAGMQVVGIGSPKHLGEATMVVRGFSGLTPRGVLLQLDQARIQNGGGASFVSRCREAG